LGFSAASLQHTEHCSGCECIFKKNENVKTLISMPKTLSFSRIPQSKSSQFKWFLMAPKTSRHLVLLHRPQLSNIAAKVCPRLIVCESSSSMYDSAVSRSSNMSSSAMNQLADSSYASALSASDSPRSSTQGLPYSERSASSRGVVDFSDDGSTAPASALLAEVECFS
jgi:hypothetical protein